MEENKTKVGCKMAMMANLEEAVCLLIFAMAFGGAYIRRRWVRNIPKMFHRNELRKEREIAKKKLEIESVNTPDQLHLHGKATRQLIVLEKELEALKEAHRNKSVLVRWAPYFVGVMVEFGFVIPVTMLWGDLEIAMLPPSLMGGLWGKLFSGSWTKFLTLLPGAVEYVYWRLADWNASPHEIDVKLRWSPVFLSNEEWQLQQAVATARRPGAPTNDRSDGVVFSVGHDELWWRSVGPFGWFVLCFIAARHLLRMWDAYTAQQSRATASKTTKTE